MAWGYETGPDAQTRLDGADVIECEERVLLDSVWGGIEFTESDGTGAVPSRTDDG